MSHHLEADLAWRCHFPQEGGATGLSVGAVVASGSVPAAPSLAPVGNVAGGCVATGSPSVADASAGATGAASATVAGVASTWAVGVNGVAGAGVEGPPAAFVVLTVGKAVEFNSGCDGEDNRLEASLLMPAPRYRCLVPGCH